MAPPARLRYRIIISDIKKKEELSHNLKSPGGELHASNDVVITDLNAEESSSALQTAVGKTSESKGQDSSILKGDSQKLPAACKRTKHVIPEQTPSSHARRGPDTDTTDTMADRIKSAGLRRQRRPVEHYVMIATVTTRKRKKITSVGSVSVTSRLKDKAKTTQDLEPIQQMSPGKAEEKVTQCQKPELNERLDEQQDDPSGDTFDSEENESCEDEPKEVKKANKRKKPAGPPDASSEEEPTASKQGKSHERTPDGGCENKRDTFSKGDGLKATGLCELKPVQPQGQESSTGKPLTISTSLTLSGNDSPTKADNDDGKANESQNTKLSMKKTRESCSAKQVKKKQMLPSFSLKQEHCRQELKNRK